MPHQHDVVRSDALLICRNILEWQATQEQWEDIGKLVDLLADAVTAGDWSSIHSAAAELELISPIRIKLAGEKTPPEGAPAPLRERVSRTISELAKTSSQADRPTVHDPGEPVTTARAYPSDTKQP
jgi:hypothetical protein